MAVALEKFNNSLNYKEKLKNFLNSYWSLLIITIVVALCWEMDAPYLSISLMLIFEIFVLIFCNDNPKGVIVPILYVPFCFNTLPRGGAILILSIVHVLLFFIAIFIYVGYKMIKEKFKPIKGKMFWPFIALFVGNLLGGIIGFFDLFMTTLLVICMLTVFGVYWFYLNFIKNNERYIAVAFIFITLTSAIEIFISYLGSQNILFFMQNKSVSVGTGNMINTAAITMLLGICGCFYLAKHSKRDYLYILLALFFDFAIFVSYSRIATAVALIITVVYFFLNLKGSKNKKILLIALAITCAIILLLIIIFFKQFCEISLWYLKMNFSLNGRSELWGWCSKKFLENPVFGVGFLTKDPFALVGGAPGIYDDFNSGFAFIYAHNYFLHHLTCTGIIGTLLNLPFVFFKYKAIFKNFSYYKLFVLIAYICFFINSLFDTSPLVSIFFVGTIYMLIATTETSIEPPIFNKSKNSKNKGKVEKIDNENSLNA